MSEFRGKLVSAIDQTKAMLTSAITDMESSKKAVKVLEKELNDLETALETHDSIMGESQPHGQGELIDGANAIKKEGKYRKPKNIKSSKHRPKVVLGDHEKMLLRGAYYEVDPDTMRPRYKVQDIQGRFNVSSGEMYRILESLKRGLPNRIQGWRRLPLDAGTVPPLKTEDCAPLTEASAYLFETYGRHSYRWQNQSQKEAFESCEAQMGSAIMKKAIDWAFKKGITNVKAIITASYGWEKVRK